MLTLSYLPHYAVESSNCCAVTASRVDSGEVGPRDAPTQGDDLRDSPRSSPERYGVAEEAACGTLWDVEVQPDNMGDIRYDCWWISGTEQ